MKRRNMLSTLAATTLAATLRPTALLAAKPTPGIALDLAIVRAAMAIHPGSYLHQNSRDFAGAQASFEAAYRAAAEVEDMRAAYLALSRFLASLRCGHSYANFFNQDDADVRALFDRPTRLPFHFRWVGDKMIVMRDPSPMALPPGTEVIELNGLSGRRMLAALLPYTRGDGGNDGKRRSLLSVEGREDYETFDIFQGLLLPPPVGGHKLKVRQPGGKVAERSCAPITLADRRAMMTRAPETGDAPRWTWEQRADGIAVLTMPGWAMWNSKWDWRTWLDDRLDSLTGARGLIVDIRDNEGGDDCGDPILARLIDSPLQGWPFDLRLRFDAIPQLLREHSNTWDQSFYDLGAGATPLANGYFAPGAGDGQSTILPGAKRISCPVAALIGPVNSSATFAFINAARTSGRVKLVGETTGGNRRGVNGGAFLFVKLPFSGIVFDLPLKGYVARSPQPDQGISPDFPIRTRAANIAMSQDPAMAKAVDLCIADKA